MFTIVCGLHETEYGYTSVNEMESVKVDGSKYGVDEIFQVEQLDGFKPVKLKSIPDEDLQAFLHNMECPQIKSAAGTLLLAADYC